MALVGDGGLLRIPLYHGTSTTFRPSIEQFGLGGVQIGEQFRLVERLVLAVSLVGTLQPGNDWLVANDPLLKTMLDDHDKAHSSRALNFRYGGTYLSPSRQTAVRYAENSHGSELLSIVAEAIEQVKQVAKARVSEVVPPGDPLWDLIDGPHRPIVVVVPNIAISSLSAESGGDADTLIRRLEGLDEDQFEVLAQQINFQVRNAINPRHLVFESS